MLGIDMSDVAPEGQPGARPMPVHATGRVVQHGANLGPQGRLAGPQEDRYRPAALDGLRRTAWPSASISQ